MIWGNGGGTPPAFPVATSTSLHTYHGCTGFLSSRKNQPTCYLLSARRTLTKNDLGARCYGFFESFRHAGPAMTFCFWGVVSRCLLGPQSTVFLHLWHTYYFPQDYFSLSLFQQSTQTHIYISIYCPRRSNIFFKGKIPIRPT